MASFECSNVFVTPSHTYSQAVLHFTELPSGGIMFV